MDNILSKLRSTPQQEDKSLVISSSPDTVTSSQCQTPFTTMKLDFQRLKNIKQNEECVSISDLLITDKYKITGYTFGLVKKIEKFSSEICYVEIVDETGSIGCSCMFDVINLKGIRVGVIVKLCDFSLWKVDSNHVNIVDRNICDVY